MAKPPHRPTEDDLERAREAYRHALRVDDALRRTSAPARLLLDSARSVDAARQEYLTTLFAFFPAQN